MSLNPAAAFDDAEYRGLAASAVVQRVPAADIAAMQSEALGGYIVVGADDHGAVVSDLTPELAKLFDEATLRAKLTKYLAEPLNVRSAQCAIDGNTVVLIYVGPNEHGWAIFRVNGEYRDQHGKDKCVFRIGEVFVRHGTASERWKPEDQARLIKQIVARHKDAWSAELREHLTAITTTAQSVQQLQALPAEALTWQLDASTFDELVLELIRRGDDIPLRRMLGQAPKEASALLREDQDELRRLLDRLTSMAALAIQYERPEWLTRILAALVRIYEHGLNEHGFDPEDLPSTWLWLDVVSRVYGLGGLAVRLRSWEAIRPLADRRPDGEPFSHYGSWLRHALTQAARRGLFESTAKSGLLARAHNVVRTIETLHPDCAADDEVVLDSLCQFDLYGAVVVIGERGDLDSGNFYPSFGRYYMQRTLPAFVRIVTDSAVRRQLFGGSDTLLADAIVEINRVAHSEGFSISGWAGIADQRVVRFVERHRTRFA